jgi:hypothetical protein
MTCTYWHCIHLVLAISWGLLLTACQVQVEDTPMPPTPPSTVAPTEEVTSTQVASTEVTPLATEPITPTSAQIGITGVVIAESDVGSQPDTPLGDQIVVAIDEEDASTLLGLPAGDWDTQALRFLHTSVSSSADGVFITRTDGDGRYMLPLEPGIYALCLADSAADGVTLELRGCGRVEVTVGAVQMVNISGGFGEILLE